MADWNEFKRKVRIGRKILVTLGPVILILIALYCLIQNRRQSRADELPDYELKNTIYVAAEGDDSNDGSKQHPFRTIQHALDHAEAGTMIRVKDGVYEEQLVFPKSGTEEEPIVVRGEKGKRTNEGEWHMQCASELCFPAGEERITLIDLNGQSNICIENLDIGNISAKYACGIFVPACSRSIRITNCRIHDVKVEERFLVSPEESEEKVGEANAILCLGEGESEDSAIRDIEIRGNEICNNVTNWSEAVSVAGNVVHADIVNNQVHDNTNIGIDFNGNNGYCGREDLDQPRGCVARENTVYNCHCEYAHCAGIYVDGAKQITLESNEVHDCDYGIEVGAEVRKDAYPTADITVKSNYLYSNSYGGIWIGGYDESDSGMVRDVSVLENSLRDNGFSNGEPEIMINRCMGVLFSGNKFERNAKSAVDLPIIVSEMDEENTSDLSFMNNQFYTETSPDQLIFLLNKREIIGVKNLEQ